MADKKTYTVHRSMHGEGRDYERGDTRELTEADAAVLVASGALSPKGEDPIVPEHGIEHTFGAKPSAVNDGGYTSPGGEPIKTPTRKPAPKA